MLQHPIPAAPPVICWSGGIWISHTTNSEIRMKNNKTIKSDNWYWLIGNSIDGVCCHPHRKKTSEQELMAYLETAFLEDFNASRGEFDFTIYLDRQGFRLRQRYGYYLDGPKRNIIAQADYMTADAIHRVRRRGRTFWYYGHPTERLGRPVLRIALPWAASRRSGQVQQHKAQKGNNAKRNSI